MRISDVSRVFVADRGDSGVRVDVVICRHLADERSVTRTRVQSWIRDGRVTVNDRLVARVAARLAVGDSVAVALPESSPRSKPSAEHRPLDILYEDAFLLAVNKPPGLVIHPSYKHPDGTLLNALLWHARRWDDGQRPSIVGRLDKDTSGIVLVAKTRAVHAGLQRAMQTATKEYIAVVYGRAVPLRGRIDLPLGRDTFDRRRVVTTPSGRPSATTFQRIDRVGAPRVGLALLCCRLGTGRMHQIRVHLAARGWPIVGDRTYGDARWREVADATLADVLRDVPRQALHAARLVFDHPVTRLTVTIEAPLPADMSRLLADAGLSDSSGTATPRRHEVTNR